VAPGTEREEGGEGTGKEFGILPVVHQNGAPFRDIPDDGDIVRIVRAGIFAVRLRASFSFKAALLQIQNGRHQL
jgi:hypothetical protein